MAEPDSSRDAAREHKQICIDTFNQTLSNYEDKFHTFVQWALMLDNGGEPQTMYISIFEEEGQFSPVQERVTDRGRSFEVIGFIEDGRARFTCGTERLAGYFSEDGQAMIQDLVVQDRIRQRRLSESQELVLELVNAAPDNEEAMPDAKPDTKAKNIKTQKLPPRRKKKGTKSYKTMTPAKLRELQREVKLDELREAAKVFFGDRFASMTETVVDLRSEAGRELACELLEYDTFLATREFGPDGGHIHFLRGLPEQLFGPP